jgi:hypothetical protein
MRVERVELDHAWTDVLQKQDSRLNAVWGNALLLSSHLSISNKHAHKHAKVTRLIWI